MTEDDFEELEEETEELDDVGLDQRIVKLMQFVGIEDLNGVQHIKLQRQFDLHQGEWIREQVVLGFTRVVGHAQDVVWDDDFIGLLPKHYSANNNFEDVTEFDKQDIEDKLVPKDKQ